MFEQMLKQMASREANKKSLKNFLVKPSSDILKKLKAKKARPMQKEFIPGDLITQETLNINKGVPDFRYRFPLEGHPAEVVAVLANPVFDDADEPGYAGYKDLIIHTFNGEEIAEYIVCSRFFRKFNKATDTGVVPPVKEAYEKLLAAQEEQQKKAEQAETAEKVKKAPKAPKAPKTRGN
jgi:hypothetical protein